MQHIIVVAPIADICEFELIPNKLNTQATQTPEIVTNAMMETWLVLSLSRK